MGQGVQAVQESGVVVVIGEDESVMTLDGVGGETETEVDTDDDAQISEKGVVN